MQNVKDNALPVSTSTKPCANCGAPGLPIGYLACAPCQREWNQAWAKSHTHLKAKRGF